LQYYFYNITEYSQKNGELLMFDSILITRKQLKK